MLERIHRAVADEWPGFDPAELDRPSVPPHPIARTKRDALAWCAQHEFVHAGQIGLLRRTLGLEPLW